MAIVVKIMGLVNFLKWPTVSILGFVTYHLCHSYTVLLNFGTARRNSHGHIGCGCVPSKPCLQKQAAQIWLVGWDFLTLSLSHFPAFVLCVLNIPVDTPRVLEIVNLQRNIFAKYSPSLR